MDQFDELKKFKENSNPPSPPFSKGGLGGLSNPRVPQSSNPSKNSSILLTLIKEDINTPLEERLKTILENEEIDWESLFKEAVYHKIAPVIYQNLKRANIASVPDNFLKNLEAIYYGNARRNIRYLSELEKILNSLRETGVEAIVLKGAALAEEVYKNPALRPVEDIDLLVRKFDFPAAKAVFKGEGYNECKNEKLFPSKIRRDLEKKLHKPFEKFDYEAQFSKNNREYLFDIHWDLLLICESKIKEEIQLNMDRIWERAKITSFGTVSACTMSPEDLLIYLCLHLRERHFERARSRIIWWYDIYKVLETYKNKLDWDYFLSSLREYEICESVFPLLLTLKELLDPPFPADLLKEFKNYSDIFPAEKIAPKASEQLKFVEKHEERDYLSNLGEIRGIGKKATLLLGDIFPQKEYMTIRYQIKDKKYFPFYYLLRLKNVLVRGLRAAFKILKSD